MRAAHLVKATGVVLLAAFALAAATGPSGAAGGYTGPARHKPRLTLSVKKQKIAKARRTGLKVKARCNVACAVTVFAYRKQSLLGRGTKRLPSRSGTVKVKFTKAGKRRLKLANSIKLALRGVAVNDSNVRSDIARKSIKLRRH